MTTIVPVNDETLQMAFLDLPRSLYREEPLWMSPNRADECLLAGFGDHGFYQHADAQAFLAFQNDTPVGRILAIDHKLYSNWNPDSVGYFGFFECIHNQEVANSLFEAAGNWLQQKGHGHFRGPLNPSINYTCGCLVNGFDQLPTFGMSYNPSWYPDLIENAGFQGVRDLLSFSATREMLDGIDPRIEATSRQAKERLGIEMRHFDLNAFDREIKSFFEVFVPTARQQWGAVPVMESEYPMIANSLRPVTVDRFTAFAELKGHPIGTVYGFPDLNPLLKKMGKDGLPGDWQLHEDFRSQIKKVRLAVTLVEPQYNLWGVGPLLTWFLLEQTLSDPNWNSSVQEVEYSWILDNNRLSRSTVERGGAIHHRTHRIYQRPLT